MGQYVTGEFVHQLISECLVSNAHTLVNLNNDDSTDQNSEENTTLVLVSLGNSL